MNTKWFVLVVVLVGCNAADTQPRETAEVATGLALVHACDGLNSPFADAACLEGLSNACRAQSTEADCVAISSVMIGGDSGSEIGCSWTQVTPVTDAQACTVGPAFGRCEATLDNLLSGCTAPTCKAGDDPADWLAIPTNGELIRSCSVPLGAWAWTGAEPGAYLMSCGEHVIPASPPLCSCIAAACAAP